MGLLDRMKSTDDLEFDDPILGDPRTQGSLSTLVADKPLVLRRMELMVEHMTKSIDDGTKKGKRTAYLVKKLIQEASEEIADAPPEMISFYIERSAALMYWAATGERILNMPLPKDFDPPAELCTSDPQTMTELEYKAWMTIESKPDPELVDAEQRRAIMSGETE